MRALCEGPVGDTHVAPAAPAAPVAPAGPAAAAVVSASAADQSGAGTLARSVDVLVVGAGPAGLSTAVALAAGGVGRVEVVEREPHAGGALRCAPPAWPGLREMRRTPAGPVAARRLADAAVSAGATVRTWVGVTDWVGPLTVQVTGPQGRELITARVIVLATGARERPRAARGVPGARGAGVFTGEGALRALHWHGQRVGTAAVVVGEADDPGYRVAGALRRAGTDIVALTGAMPMSAAHWPHRALVRLGWGVPLLGCATVSELIGRHGQITGVRLRRTDGARAELRCDAVVFCGAWVPENELARAAGLALAADRGPRIDAEGRTSRPGIFAVGALVRPAAPARAAVLAGHVAARAVRDYLAGAPWPLADQSVTIGEHGG
ncbi:NAD(P)/FAD-dependent oxidoreductase [Streptomyces zagrosensis]|uniref:NAD(P)/FAD-dependent oxidoreductase n=1 Tax=Streptomyces zagrosensis TaxID=1042984 RepID=UPI0028ADF96C|nr:FAD-dependent oxidoreductase [Streptomyces zagrosensis]